MAQNGKKVQELILSKLDSIEREVKEGRIEMKEVRQVDIPKLKVEMAIVKEKSSNSAKIITAIGGAITIAVSSVIAYMK